MIRNVVVGQLRNPDSVSDRDQLSQGLEGIAGLKKPGLLSMNVGLDEGLRDGGWTFAITNDWESADAYRAYDIEPEHNQFRKMIGEVCENIARVQFVTEAG